MPQLRNKGPVQAVIELGIAPEESTSFYEQWKRMKDAVGQMLNKNFEERIERLENLQIKNDFITSSATSSMCSGDGRSITLVCPKCYSILAKYYRIRRLSKPSVEAKLQPGAIVGFS